MARVTETRDVSPIPGGTRIASVVSTYHLDVTEEMVASARDTLSAAGLAPTDFLEFRVPGAFELPLVARRLAARPDVAAVLAFGLVLKGETEHDRHIAGAVADGLMRVSLETDTPVLFGVLTCASLDQARARARRAADGGLDKGHEVARAAANVLATLAETKGDRGRLEEVR